LDSAESAVDASRQRPGQDGFPNAGDVFDQNMSAGDEPDQQQIDCFGLSEEDLGDVRAEPVNYGFGHSLTPRRAPQNTVHRHTIFILTGWGMLYMVAVEIGRRAPGLSHLSQHRL
jgi:hypothetical protein